MKYPAYKSFTDPVHGFIPVPHGVVMRLIESPEIQRLRRIRQLGVGHMVFPGAEHSRFGHALGAMALMNEVLDTLIAKGTSVSRDERLAALSAALLHDVGHGPYSHTLEHTLISGFAHEQMSRVLMVRLAEQIGEPLDLALSMFDDAYERPFFHQLVSSQLDMDRLDYLRRDTYYSGVAEGAVGVARIVRNLRVHPAENGSIVVDQKGLHAVENFLMARRLMYWQVYLHKAVVAGDRLLRSTLLRARDLLSSGSSAADDASPTLLFFLSNNIDAADLQDDAVVHQYTLLDDADILYSLKRWSHSDDSILSDLASSFLTRQFPRVTFLSQEPGADLVDDLRQRVVRGLRRDGAADGVHQLDRYYFAVDRADHAAYESKSNSIHIVDTAERVEELSQHPDAITVSALTAFEERWYICAPKGIELDLPAEALS